MTVEELITHLQKFPKDTTVGCVYLCYSDYVILEPEDIRYYDKNEKMKGPYGSDHRYVLRNGKIMEYNEKTWDKSEVPNFVSVIAFLGN